MSGAPSSITRINGALADIRAALQQHPDIRERAAAFFSGHLEGAENMADDQEQGQMARVPADIGRRAHKVLEAMRAAGAPELYAAPRASWAAVIRLALTLGLEQLEKRYPSHSKPD